jgi:hypothetical protein
MKTAVDQLAISLYEGGYLKGNGDEIQELVDKAKEMEKEKMIEFAWIYSDERISRKDLILEFNETYRGNK